MSDFIDKVLKGFDTCRPNIACDGCPYHNIDAESEESCMDFLMDDATSLVKKLKDFPDEIVGCKDRKKEKKEMSVEKVQPNASLEYSDGNDGRDGHYYIQYSCPTCGKLIRVNDIACDKCCTFFSWDKKAFIRITRSIEWK